MLKTARNVRKVRSIVRSSDLCCCVSEQASAESVSHASLCKCRARQSAKVNKRHKPHVTLSRSTFTVSHAVALLERPSRRTRQTSKCTLWPPTVNESISEACVATKVNETEKVVSAMEYEMEVFRVTRLSMKVVETYHNC